MVTVFGFVTGLQPTVTPVINCLLLSDRAFIHFPLKLAGEICTAWVKRPDSLKP